MRRDKDIIGYMYNDTEQKLREQIADKIEEHCKELHGLTRCFCDEAAAIARDVV